MRSSGTTAISTSSDAAVDVLTADSRYHDREVTVTNTGTAAGFVSINGGTTWFYLPPGITGAPVRRTFDLRHRPFSAHVQVKRIASGSNLSGIYADAY